MKKPLSLNDRLAAEEQDEDLVKFRDFCLDLVKKSRSKMSKHYPRWNRNRETYKSERQPDIDDLEAREVGDPEKIIVPMGFAQANTFIAFAFLLYVQNSKFFELAPRGQDDYQTRFDCEDFLERDLRRNNWLTKLYQLLLDATLTGVCVTKEWWTTKKEVVFPPTSGAEGFFSDGEQPGVELIIEQGNEIVNISPYNFFPDWRVPLSDWKKGQFIADETEVTKFDLETEERDGTIFGLKFVEAMDKEKLKSRGGTQLKDFAAQVNGRKRKSRGGAIRNIDEETDNSLVCRLELQIKVIPKDHNLGFEKYPCTYLVQILNDSRIVRMEKMGYLHKEFTYNVGELSPDQHEQIGRALTDPASELQEIQTFLFNSRIHGIRRGLDGKTIVDPDFFDQNSFSNPESPFIFLRKGAPKVGSNNWASPLPYVDATRSNFDDSQFIDQLAQRVTGVNENAMGNVNPGRRSATEARAANSGAASRMKMAAILIWNSCVAPMGKKLLINARQGIDFEIFRKIFGESADLELRYSLFRPNDWTTLVANEDHFVMDGTIESEKVFLAQALQELLTVLIQNPVNAQLLDLNPVAMLEEMMQLRGLGRKNRFSLNQNPQTNGQLPGTINGIPPELAGVASAVPGQPAPSAV